MKDQKVQVYRDDLYGFPPWKEKLYFSNRNDIHLLDSLYKPHSWLAKFAMFSLKIRFLNVFMMPLLRSRLPGISELGLQKPFAVVRGSNEKRLKFIAAYFMSGTLVFEKFCDKLSTARFDILREKRILEYLSNSSYYEWFDHPQLIDCRTSNYISLKTRGIFDSETGKSFSSLPSPSLRDLENFCSQICLKHGQQYKKERTLVWVVFTNVETMLGKQGLLSNDLKDEMTTLCLCHGDLTPWNAKIVNSKFYLIDFEHCRLRFPPYYDLIHFWHSTLVLLDRVPIKNLADFFPSLLKQCSPSRRDQIILAGKFYYCLKFLRGDIDIDFLMSLLNSLSGVSVESN
jgi:hypothetical protein